MPVSVTTVVGSTTLNSSRQVYSSGSSLTTRRKHLGKDHRPQYLQLIADRKLPNKLPEALQKEREEQRARDMQRTLFSIAAFEEKLVQVIVSNNLVGETLSFDQSLIHLLVN